MVVLGMVLVKSKTNGKPLLLQKQRNRTTKTTTSIHCYVDNCDHHDYSDFWSNRPLKRLEKGFKKENRTEKREARDRRLAAMSLAKKIRKALKQKMSNPQLRTTLKTENEMALNTCFTG